MQLNGNQWCQQSAENLHASADTLTGSGDLAGGGGLQVLGQAVESTTTSISKPASGEAAPVLEAPSTKDSSGSAGTDAVKHEGFGFGHVCS